MADSIDLGSTVIDITTPQYAAWVKAMSYGQKEEWSKFTVHKIKYAIIIEIDDSAHIDIVSALFSEGCKVEVDRRILEAKLYVTGRKRCWPWEAPPYLIGFGPMPRIKEVHDSLGVTYIRSDALLTIIQMANVPDVPDTDDDDILPKLGGAYSEG